MLLVAAWAREAGLAPAIDRFGNLWALPDGADGSVVTSGSHVDTVPDGGRYDGALGTVLALELADSVPGAGLLVCAAEEAPRFGAGTVGSRLLVGTLPEDELGNLRDADGVTAAAARDELPRCAGRPAAGRAAGRARPRPRGGTRGPTARAAHARDRDPRRVAAAFGDRARRRERPLGRGVDGEPPRRTGRGGRGRARRRAGGPRRATGDRRDRRHDLGRAGRAERDPRAGHAGPRRARHRF